VYWKEGTAFPSTLGDGSHLTGSDSLTFTGVAASFPFPVPTVNFGGVCSALLGCGDFSFSLFFASEDEDEEEEEEEGVEEEDSFFSFSFFLKKGMLTFSLLFSSLSFSK